MHRNVGALCVTTQQSRRGQSLEDLLKGTHILTLDATHNERRARCMPHGKLPIGSLAERPRTDASGSAI